MAQVHALVLERVDVPEPAPRLGLRQAGRHAFGGELLGEQLHVELELLSYFLVVRAHRAPAAAKAASVGKAQRSTSAMALVSSRQRSFRSTSSSWPREVME